MSSLSILFLLALSGGPSPADIANDLDAHPWSPAPAAPVSAQSSPRTAVQPPPQAPGPTTPAIAPAVASPRTPAKETSAQGSWRIQLAALSSPDAANAEKARLENLLGLGAVDVVAEGSVYKLRYGRFGTKDEAETARAGLKAKGVDGFAVLRP